MNEGAVTLTNPKNSAEMYARQTESATKLGIKYFGKTLDISVPLSVELEKSPKLDLFIKEASNPEFGFNKRSINYIVEMAKNFRL